MNWHISAHAPCSDWSFLSPATVSDTLPHARASRFLYSLSATGAVVTHTAHGYTLCPTQPSVTLSYSTQTCDEFYRLRSAAWPQDCEAKQPLLSTIVTGAQPKLFLALRSLVCSSQQRRCAAGFCPRELDLP